MSGSLKLFSGNANRELAAEIAESLGLPLGEASVGRFRDGEINVKILENVRGADCFVVQPTHSPAEHWMELFLMLDALQRASAWRVTAVIPYFGYARQDRKSESRVPISAKLVANLLTKAGADRVLAMDLHAGQIQGFFDIPVDHLYAKPVLIEYFRKKRLANGKAVVVSPDAAGVERARSFAKLLKAGLAIIDKRRLSPSEAAAMRVVGDVKGKDTLIIDDLMGTGSTLIGAGRALKEAGASKVFAAATHAVFSASALERLSVSPVEELITTNTIPVKRGASDRVKVLSVAHLLGDGIRRIHDERSISELFI